MLPVNRIGPCRSVALAGFLSMFSHDRIWAAIEPLDRMAFDRELRASFEQVRVITGALILPDDVVDNQPVSRVDKQLGVSIGVLT